jgi:polar amino acid transport system substrate-binding protein
MRPRLLRAALAVGAMWAIALSPSPARAERKFVIVGEAYPPFEYQENGQPRGINVELVTQIFAKLGVPVEFRFYPFARAWMLMEGGHADAITSVSYTPAREKALIFTPEQRAFLATGCVPRDHLWLTDYVFFVKSAVQKGLRFESLQQIHDDRYRVGLVTDYSYSPEFLKAELDTRTYSNPEEGFRALVAGEIQVFPFDRTVGHWILKREGLHERVSLLPRPIFVKPYELGFSRLSGYPDMEGLLQAFYRELADLRSSGEYDRISSKYLSAETDASPPRPLVFVAESWPPYEWADTNGCVRGIDAEIVGRIMKRIGVPYSIRLYPWSRAWLMIQKGSADAVLSVSYKESREADLAYTDLQRTRGGANQSPDDTLWLSEYVFFVKKRDVGRFRFESLDQVKSDGIVIGVNRDYTYTPEFLAADLSSVEYTSTRDGFQGLVADEIQLYPIDRTVGQAQLNELGLSQSITNLPKVIFSKPYLAVFSKHSTYPHLDTIRSAFYSELARLRTSGEYDDIRRANIEAQRK